MPALFLAVADYLAAGVGAAPSASPSMPARPREPVYRSPRGRTHHFLRALPAIAASSAPVRVRIVPTSSAGGASAFCASNSSLATAAVGAGVGAVSADPVPGLSRDYWNDDEVPGTPRDPDVDWRGVSWPHLPREENWNWSTPPPSPPCGEPQPGDGAYQARGVRLSEVDRCVTELSFVLDLQHVALQSREVVARDPQLSEDQQGRPRRAVSSALWDVLHLPLEPEDPLLDDGPGTAAFCMVATAAEESTLGIVPAIVYVLRWLGWRVSGCRRFLHYILCRRLLLPHCRGLTLVWPFQRYACMPVLLPV
ncbi:unnamed protein product [Closterium sp. Naga37s-1]|nr:unnamed protein product [Closterium sp. Naga37s-1]